MVLVEEVIAVVVVAMAVMEADEDRVGCTKWASSLPFLKNKIPDRDSDGSKPLSNGRNEYTGS